MSERYPMASFPPALVCPQAIGLASCHAPLAACHPRQPTETAGVLDLKRMCY